MMLHRGDRIAAHLAATGDDLRASNEVVHALARGVEPTDAQVRMLYATWRRVAAAFLFMAGEASAELSERGSWGAGTDA